MSTILLKIIWEDVTIAQKTAGILSRHVPQECPKGVVMNAWWWILHVGLATLGSIMFWVGAFFGNNLYEGELHYGGRSGWKENSLVAVLFWGGAAIFFWAFGMPLWEGIANNQGPLATWKGVAAFFALDVTALIAVMGTGAGLMFLPDLLEQRECRKNGGHYFKRVPLIEGICYEERCECGKKGQSGPYVREGDPEWGW